MDKPTPPKAMTETESAPGWPAGTKGCLLVTDAQIEAFGEAMAAWGAAQERERMQARIDALMLEHCPDEMSDEQKRNWAANQVPAQQGAWPFPSTGAGLTECDMHDDESH